MNQILRFDDVQLYYEHVNALKGVSIVVNEGETVALIGANGAGKSSILRAITGLRRVRSGEMALGVSMYPTTMEQLLAVSDAGEIMPPKSTWFEPKLRSGLFVHELK